MAIDGEWNPLATQLHGPFAPMPALRTLDVARNFLCRLQQNRSMEPAEMLTISHAQMERLEEAMVEKFVSRLCASLRAACGAETEGATDDDLRDFVRYSMEDASNYRLTTEKSIADFVGLAVQLGADFHQHPLVFDRLIDNALPPDERVAALFAQLTEAEWDEVADFAALREEVNQSASAATSAEPTGVQLEDGEV